MSDDNMSYADLVTEYKNATEMLKGHRATGADLVKRLIVAPMTDLGLILEDTWRLDGAYYHTIKGGEMIGPGVTMTENGEFHCKLIVVIRHDDNNRSLIPLVVRMNSTVDSAYHANVYLGASATPIVVDPNSEQSTRAFRHLLFQHLKHAVRSSVASFL